MSGTESRMGVTEKAGMARHDWLMNSISDFRFSHSSISLLCLASMMRLDCDG